MNLRSKLIAITMMAVSSTYFVAPVGAAPISSLSMVQGAATPLAENVYYRGGWRGGRGVGIGAGIVAGAIIGGALLGARPYGYGYAPVYDDGYGYGGYRAVAPYANGDAVGYCQQRFRSYDPSSGTYLGFDGMRHPCP